MDRGEGPLLQRGVERLVKQGMEASRGGVLLREDLLGCLHALLITGPAGHALEHLVGADLEMLERVGKRGELGGRVGLGAKEGRPVERPEAQSGVLELRRARTTGIKPGGDQLLMAL